MCAGFTPGMRENNGLIEFQGKLYLFGGGFVNFALTKSVLRLQWSAVAK